MNRQRLVDRDRDFEAEGDERAQRLALSLAQNCDADFLEALAHHKAALDEFGGEVYIAAAPRAKFNRGEMVDASEPGNHETVGYVFHYSHRCRLKGQETEEDINYGGDAPTIEMNGAEPAEEAEPVESTS